VLDPSLREENSILKEPNISYLGVQDLGLDEPPITDLSEPIIVQVYPYEFQIVSQETMETNAANSSGNSHIPSMAITTGGFPPPNQPSPV
jgi:hypothetical protein